MPQPQPVTIMYGRRMPLARVSSRRQAGMAALAVVWAREAKCRCSPGGCIALRARRGIVRQLVMHKFCFLHNHCCMLVSGVE